MSAVHSFRRTFTEFNRRLAAASDADLSMADTLALQFIAHAGAVTAGEIGRFTGLTSGSVTMMLDRLEEAGLVMRRRSAEDRRVIHVDLQPGARQRIMASMVRAHEDVAGLFDDLSSADIERLVGLMERLRFREASP